MRKLKATLGLFVAMACTQAYAQNSYNITGTAEGFDGTVVKLTAEDKTTIDSTVVANGKFQLTGPLTVQVASLTVGTASENIILHENPMNVEYKMATVTSRTGEATERPSLTIINDKEYELMKEVNDSQLFEIITMMAIALSSDSTAAPRDSMVMLYTTIQERNKVLQDSVVRNCNDNYAAANVMNQFMAREKTYAELKPLWDNLTPRVKESGIGKKLEATMQKLAAVGVGSIAPDITLPTPDGKELSLSSLRGKVVLLDFWASWCGPCLAEAPNVKKVYDKYKDKGFDVFGVSLDKETQRDAWLKAIEKHQLTWHHVSSLKGWECPVAGLYNVTAIPATFLLDREGRIVATNCRGEKLEEEVSKLCK